MCPEPRSTRGRAQQPCVGAWVGGPRASGRGGVWARQLKLESHTPSRALARTSSKGEQIHMERDTEQRCREGKACSHTRVTLLYRVGGYPTCLYPAKLGSINDDPYFSCPLPLLKYDTYWYHLWNVTRCSCICVKYFLRGITFSLARAGIVLTLGIHAPHGSVGAKRARKSCY